MVRTVVFVSGSEHVYHCTDEDVGIGGWELMSRMNGHAPTESTRVTF